MNVPNLITMTRILLIPVFLFLVSKDAGVVKISVYGYMVPIEYFWATTMFLLLSLTDWVDGYIARRYNAVTKLGKFLDPLADKLLMTAGFIVLVEMNLLPSWMVILILSREFAVTGIRLIAASEGKVIAAAYVGKVKTTLQILTITMFMIGLNGLYSDIVLWAMLVITVYSGLDYFLKSKELIIKKTNVLK